MYIFEILLVLLVLATAGVLMVGLVGFFRGGEFNRKYSNVLMRWRVGLQFAALAVLAILFLAYS
ncbi:MAG TPA: twin transmembrane helix small protein [Geminicoccus sp.]|mgnify:CR=1 FL=1|uniref:twin transmembrane helix small protein n=1 Tax=Geminicoccus TaxID=489140 RepID=UPI00168A749F|nr:MULTISPECIES: twin transmembrane helix small protein [Geminicoccus]HWL70586.1 twin transmembrane helix small protein [Geminicoccus sp.]